MQQVISDQIMDFSAIYDKNIELVSVTRTKLEQLESLAEQVFSSRTVLDMQWKQQPMDTELPLRELRASIGDSDGVGTLAKEIIDMNELLYELLGCKEIGVRVTTLNTPMCPRFHADAVVCRLLITIGGPGTEWIASNDVNRKLLADRDTDAIPIKDGKAIRRLRPGSMSLLKGGAWQKEFAGVVHRSPHKEGQRLLLSFDPIFPK